MTSTSASRRLIAAGLALATLVACDPTATSLDGGGAEIDHEIFQSADFGALDAATKQDLAALLAYASPLHRLERAMEAGFNTPLTECRDNPPVGGMGYHYGNLGRLFDPSPPTALEPEVLVYAPKKNGKLQLAAAEYVIPFVIWEGPPPTLFGQTFIANEADQVWQLHVWLWRHNPAGLFKDWNPVVSCDT